MSSSVAVMLLSFGTPDDPNDTQVIERFLHNIRGGRPTPPALVREVQTRYQRIGGSPLNRRVAAIAQALHQRLQEQLPHSQVFVGNLYWEPYISEVARQMHQAGYRHWVAVPLAPQYSRVSVANYLRAVEQAASSLRPRPHLHLVRHWGEHPGLIAAWAEQVRQAWARFPSGADIVTVFTAHSIPERFVAEGDPYPQEVEATARLVAEAVGLSRWQVAYQSAGAQAVPWLGPDVQEVVRTLAEQGVQHVLVVPVGFLTDHEEVLYDLDIELRAETERLGIHMERAAMPNAHPALIEALADLTLHALDSSLASQGRP